MKKIINIYLIITFVFVYFFTPIYNVEAKTLGDLKRELEAQIKDYQQAQKDKELTEKQIEQIKQNVSSIYNEIEQNQNTIVDLDNEIKELEIDIEKKENEIKEIMKYYQLSQGESMYLEYAFGATDFTDFIYRLAISEQLSKYNDELIKKQNEMIEQNKIAQQNLQEKEKELLIKQEQLNKQLDSLGSQLSEIVDIKVDIEEEIKMQREAIELYEKQYNCKDSDEISVCTAKKLPADTAFWRPLIQGYRTSEYGYRTYRLNGKTVTDFHTGIDISTSPSSNVPIYAAAAGKVVAVVNRSSCGGNKIFIHHNINGKSYTTAYNHLRKILVSVGDTVTKETQIAIMGGDPRIETWDQCSTGAHLHFSIATGLYLKDYSSWNTFISRTVNPRNLVNFPAGGQSFYNRTIKY